MLGLQKLLFPLLITSLPIFFCKIVYILYHPLDITKYCASSHHLSFDLSFGMGMSDTLTVVTRTQEEINYECDIEFVAAADDVIIITVFQFPNAVRDNCLTNKAFMIINNHEEDLSLCDLLSGNSSGTPFFVATTMGSLQFKFTSNSSVNYDMDASHYQITATTARFQPENGCSAANESNCEIRGVSYCFTNGVVCDGIKNCGFPYWFDERSDACGNKQEHLNVSPMLTIFIFLICVALVFARFVFKLLPPTTNAFLIYNNNEDNRLCIDPVFANVIDAENRETPIKPKSLSLIPISSSSSEEEDSAEIPPEAYGLPTINKLSEWRQKSTLKSVTERFQERIRYVTGFRKEGKAEKK